MKGKEFITKLLHGAESFLRS